MQRETNGRRFSRFHVSSCYSDRNKSVLFSRYKENGLGQNLIPLRKRAYIARRNKPLPVARGTFVRTGVPVSSSVSAYFRILESITHVTRAKIEWNPEAYVAKSIGVDYNSLSLMSFMSCEAMKFRKVTL